MTRANSKAGFSSLIGLAVLLAVLAPCAMGQSYLTQVGPTTFSTKVPIELGYLDAATGNLHLEIPLGSWPQRGGWNLNAALVYDSRIWFVNNGVWSPNNVSAPYSYEATGWRLVTNPVGGGTTSYSTNTGYCQINGKNWWYDYYTNFTWVDPWGTQHNFPIFTENDPHNCDNGTTPSDTELATDATGYTMNVTNYTNINSITAPDGTQIYPAFKDRNGNYLVNSGSSGYGVTDTLGRVVVAESSACSQSFPYCYYVLNSQGTTSLYVGNYTSQSLHTAFHQSGVTEYSGTANLLTSLTLPDGTSYQMTYDTQGYGELASITLPTGGTISYGWETYFDMFGNANRWLAARTTPTGGWFYDAEPLSPCSSGYSFCQTERAGGPSGNVTFTFNSNVGSNGAWLTQATYPDRQVSTNWSSVLTGPQQMTVTETRTDFSNIEKTTQYTYFSPNYPNVSSIAEYNYYANGPLPASPDRTTNFSNYCGTSPGTVTLTNGATVTQTNTTFDAYGSGGLTSITGIINHDDTNFGVTHTTRCNATSIAALVSGSTYLTTSMTYDTTGQVLSVTDPKNNTTTMSYADKFYNENNANPPASYTPPHPTNAYLTSVTLPVLGTSTMGYYFGTGQLAVATDVNSQTSYQHFYDSMSRPTGTTAPDGGWSVGAYTNQSAVDSYLGINSTTPSISCSSCRHDRAQLDSLGRLQYQSLMSDPDGQTMVAISYDSGGRVSAVTAPYRSTSSSQDTYTYDNADRVVTVTHADGNTVNTYFGSSAGTSGGLSTQLCSSSYGIGYPILTTDENGNKRQTWADGFGRLIEVDEPDSNNNLTVNTCYAYDVNDNLTGVLQGSQSRSYVYDGLSRLTTATAPESGTTYTYYTTSGGALCAGAASAVCRHTDNRGATITYSYDALNRVSSKSYSDGTAPASYFYDESSVTLGSWTSPTLTNSKGRLTHACTGTATGSCTSFTTANVFGYDLMGRPTIYFQCTPANCTNSTFWQMNYAYDLAGDVKSWTHPLGFTITNTIGNAMRATQVSSSLNDSAHPGTLATITYAPSGAINTLVNGCAGSSCVNIQETYSYNNRMQPTMIELGTTANPSANSCLVYNYYPSVLNPSSCAQPGQATSGDNGNIVAYFFQDSTHSSLGHTAAFQHDAMRRLTSAVATGSSTYNLTFAYDRYGNMACQTNASTNGPCPNWSFNGNNQITTSGFSYDAGGNLTNDGTHSYQWDAEGRQASVDGGATTTVVYDALGDRAERHNSSGSVEYIRDLSGNVIGSAAGTGAISNAFIWTNGRMVADYESGAYFDHVNNIGTTSQATDWTGTSVQEQLLYPWGQPWASVNYNIHSVFGSMPGYDSDLAEYQTEYRAYPPILGRWMSPDPLSGDVSNPQTLNRYSYVLNNPLAFIDPYGLTCYDKNNNKIVDPEDELLPESCWADGGVKFIPDVIQTVTATASPLPDTGAFDDLLAEMQAAYAQQIANAKLQLMGVNATDPLRIQSVLVAGMEASHDLGCVAIPGAGIVAGGTAYKLAQPVAGSKPFTTPGSSTGTSPASEFLRDAFPQTVSYGIPTPVGGPGTGTPLRMATTTSVGGAAARYLPFVGVAVAGYSAYKMNQCLSQKPQ